MIHKVVPPKNAHWLAFDAAIVVWIDTHAKRSDGRFASRIVRAIRSSRHVAVMCSKSSYEYDHVVREVHVAGELKKPFVVLQLDGTDLPDDFLFFLTGFPRLEAVHRPAKELAAEVESIVRTD